MTEIYSHGSSQLILLINWFSCYLRDLSNGCTVVDTYLGSQVLKEEQQMALEIEVLK